MSEKKISAYQKLKRKVSELENDIHLLVRYRDSPEAFLCRKKYETKFKLQDEIWSGSPTKIEKQ